MSDDQKATVARAVEWLTGQSFNNVLLALLLLAFGWLSYYALQVGIPQHLKSIQDGYERVNQQNTDAHKSNAEAFKAAIDRDAKVIDELLKPRTVATGPQ